MTPFFSPARDEVAEALPADSVAALNALLGEIGPARALLLLPHSAAGFDPGEGWTDVVHAPYLELPGGRYDVAFLFRVIEEMPAAKGRHLIASLRDIHARHVIVAVNLEVSLPGSEKPWSPADLFSLGLKRVTPWPEIDAGKSGVLALFGFSLEDYKVTPDWLNSRCWANPELYGKYRW